MRTRFLTVSVAAAVAVSGLTVPVAHGQEQQQGTPITATNEYIQSNYINKFSLPTKKPENVILQAGATESSVMLNWITEAGVEGQGVRIREAGQANDAARTVSATATKETVSVTEGDPRKITPVLTEVTAHKVTVDNLKENTEYTYSVGSEADGWSEEYTFNTGTYGDSWNFLHFGDVQVYSNKEEFQDQIAGWNNTVDQATTKFPQTSFLLSAGDQANHSSLQEHAGFMSPDAVREYRTVVNMGNHDRYHAPTYEAVYNRPNLEDENYWFTYNNALIVSLDSNDWEDFDDDVAFLRKVVKEQGADKDWVILTYHHATFSQAYHQEDRSIMYWRERMTPVFSELDVDLVLGGHDHIYTRSYLMEGHNPVDTGREAKIGETVAKKPGQVQYVTSNSASGSKYYQFFDFKKGERDEDTTHEFGQTVNDKTIRTYTAFWEQKKNPNYSNVAVTKDGLKVSTFDTVTGETVDEFTLTRAGAGQPQDPKPADPKPQDPKPQDPKQNDGASSDKNADKNNDDNGSSRNAGIAVGVIAAIAAVLGGIFFAAQQNLFAALNQFLPQI